MADVITYRDAVAEGLTREMRRDPSVVCIGEDIGAAGGVFKTTVGLFAEFGPGRVRDTPISEQPGRESRLRSSTCGAWSRSTWPPSWPPSSGPRGC